MFYAFNLVACANFGVKLKSFLRGEDAKSKMSARPSTNYGQKFSDRANFMRGPVRQYKKRTTKANLENDSKLSDRSGSLWVMEGQGAYLFSQNIMRMIGDSLSIRIDGEPKEQLESKAKVISNLLSRLNRRRRAAAEARRLAALRAQKKNKTNKKAGKDKAAQNPSQPNSGGGTKEDNVEANFPVKSVPTRIVERMTDGNYRVKGSQPFMIGKREYKVIVTGIVRAGDFSDGGISAQKLVEPKFDIVSKKRRAAKL